MSKQPYQNACCNNNRERSPNQSTSQNTRPRNSRNVSQNIDFNNTSGIYRINPYDSNQSSANCCPTNSTPRPSYVVRNPNQNASISQDFTISQIPQSGYNFVPNVSQNTNMNSPYQNTYSPQMQGRPPQTQGGPPRQQRGCCSSAPQGFMAPRMYPQNMPTTTGYNNCLQTSQQQYGYSPHQVPDPNIARKQQVSFDQKHSQPSSESNRYNYTRCPHRVYMQYSEEDIVVKTKGEEVVEADAEGEAIEIQEDESIVNDEIENAETPAACSPINPCCSPDDIYQFELPRATATPETSHCPPSSTCNKHASTVGNPCPSDSPCYRNIDMSPRSQNKFVPRKSGPPACCQLGHPSGSPAKPGEIPRTPCLPTSPCARNYTMTNKSPVEEEGSGKCCQNAYNYVKTSSSTLKSSCGQMQNLKFSGSCGASCLSAQSCTSNKSKSGRSRIPQRNSSSGSGGRQRKRFRGKSTKEDTKSDSINMLSVVISTVMFLAAELPDVPENYKKWSNTYLKCIKNLQGQSPPNIKKILKMLNYDHDADFDSKCQCPFPGKIKPGSPKSTPPLQESKEEL